MSIRRSVVAPLAVLVVAGLPGCTSASRSPWGTKQLVEEPAMARPSGPLNVNRGDWLVGKQTGVWVVTVEDGQGRPPRRLGYVTSRNHRELRGGPSFAMYEVTTTDRERVIGSVDALGNGTRFVPTKNTVEAVPVGNNRLDLTVQAIFDTTKPVTLTETTERAIAVEVVFATYDHDGDGTIVRDEKDPVKNEYPSNPEELKRFVRADANKDGRLDKTEFDATLDF